MRSLLPTPLALCLCLGLSLQFLTTPTFAQPKKASTPKASATVTIPVFDFASPITEKPSAEDMPFLTSSMPESFLSLTQRMRKAAKDDAVKAIVLMGNPPLGYAQVEEMRTVLSEIQKAGKKIYAHVDDLNTGRLMLLSGATKLSVSPTGHLMITGLYGEQLYLRGLFDKIGVTPDFLTCGAYKSAAETFMRKSASPQAKEMYGWLFDGIYDSTIEQIAKGRQVSKKQALKWIDKGIYSAESAAKLGIIDSAQHRAAFVEDIKKTFGNVAFSRKYGKPKGMSIDLSSPFGALQLWAQMLGGTKRAKSTKDAVAIIYVEGAIMPGSPTPSLFGASGGAYSDPIRKALEAAAADDTIKAVVLRVDSPGGSAVASEIILDATRRVKAKKPLVVSMGNVAGSGGYYVACGADTIFASPATITGSIGVVTGKLVTTGMWNKLGINFAPIARGKRAAMLGSSATFSDEERAELQGWMDEVYEVFKGHVVAIRGKRLKKPIDEIAGGRVFTGRQGLELGLVDKLGGLHEALAFAANEAKVKDYEIRVVPRPKNFMEALMGDLGGSEDAKQLTTGLTARSSLWQTVMPMLEGLDPNRVRAVQQAIRQVEILGREKVSLSMPVFLMQ